ncbi:MAG: 2-oxo acid dehydrogenase subunit E2 [Ruminococcaceae bacterium]|nr:2-oxo acid dehydrogenase subunit E2 [Oscillospiraceae bacterium]
MRADGRRTRNILPLYEVATHFMSRRSDAQNMLTIDIPLEPIKNYLNAKKKEGIRLSHMGLFLAAYVRTLSEYPEINRFVVNRKIYSRNEIAVGMVVLKSGDSSDETMSKMYFDVDDNVFEVERKIQEYVDENRQAGDTNSTDGILKVLLRIPFLCGFAIKFFKLLDRYGMLPKAVLDMSPFHESLLISNLASIRANHIYHHAYDFGTTSLTMTMGNMRYVPVIKNGEQVFERTIPVGIVMDDRVATGVIYSKAFRRFRELLKNPQLLEEKPETVKLDFENQYEKQKKRLQKIKAKQRAKARKK